jgi:hypothetical protein
MPFTVTCECGKALIAQEDLVGQEVRCPACNVVMTLLDPKDDPARDLSNPISTDSNSPPFEESYRSPYRRGGGRRKYTSPPMPEPKSDSISKPAYREGWFGNVNAGARAGILMMLIAVAWFFLGLMAGRIFFYPPFLLIVGFISFLKGTFKGE